MVGKGPLLPQAREGVASLHPGPARVGGLELQSGEGIYNEKVLNVICI